MQQAPAKPCASLLIAAWHPTLSWLHASTAHAAWRASAAPHRPRAQSARQLQRQQGGCRSQRMSPPRTALARSSHAGLPPWGACTALLISSCAQCEPVWRALTLTRPQCPTAHPAPVPARKNLTPMLCYCLMTRPPRRTSLALLQRQLQRHSNNSNSNNKRMPLAQPWSLHTACGSGDKPMHPPQLNLPRQLLGVVVVVVAGAHGCRVVGAAPLIMQMRRCTW